MTTDTDAREFGLHIRQGGWRLGLLVARNVEKGQRGGDTTISQARNGKVPALTFAQESGTSADRVLRYLRAWNAAAAAGHVPHGDTLAPGQDVALDVENLPAWSEFYPPNGGRPGVPTTVTKWSVEQRQAAAEQLLADPRVAEVIRKKIAGDSDRQPPQVPAATQPPPPTPAPAPGRQDDERNAWDAIESLQQACDHVESAARWLSRDGLHLGDSREAIEGLVARLCAGTDLIGALLREGGISDAALNRLIEDGAR